MYMAYLQEIEIDWNTFKTVHTTLSSATVYYLQNDLQYVPFLIEEGTSPIVAQSIYYVNVNRDPSSVSGPYAALTSGAHDSLHLQNITYTANAYGTSGITVQYVDTSTAATGTVTVVDYHQLSLDVPAPVLTVNGVSLTRDVEWFATVDNATTAASIASAITTATATTLCTAAAVGAVIT